MRTFGFLRESTIFLSKNAKKRTKIFVAEITSMQGRLLVSLQSSRRK